MAQPHAVVVGAGIGGLAAALALRLKGWSVAVYERAPVVEPGATGLVLSANALRALDALGVGAQVRALGVRVGGTGVRRQDGRWIMHGPRVHPGDPDAVVLASSVLVEALLAAIGGGPETLHTGTAITSVDPGDTRRPARVATDTGDLGAELVVVADGVRSPLRAELFLEHPGAVYAGFTSWRAVVEPRPVDFGESWGRGGVVGVLPFPGGRLYCYATANLPAGQRAGDERAEIVARLADWHAPIPDLFTGAAPEAVVRTDIWHVDTPLPAYHKGRVAVLGDAAHSMTPHLGLGAGLALEDAVVLAHHIDGSTAYVPTALQSYSEARLPRTTALVQRSAQLAEAVQSESPFLTRLRDTAMTAVGLMAPRVLTRYMHSDGEWHPPGGPPL
ncbi:2-polyprenyl-6-methoxyphenol hydroxylase-like FAD-dependent oxidoreductase [Murinocardiopsis flavida]|uniref:2-polyprenyl-6-methoxyphenol hydroxylase-like FAD-dependent oxidoreductase n=1 Tax=Murinocardiopsis flavida TaxID=645275 RepID=A0A2P8DJB5_9ACTN|nr:FAD-dependent monooxygenase [Murinocardiopsis flavida]PSK97316.1 2-polyprenyl-6-methoxyphenol hydroxylase-like FAD-dependent oxidoreductase [Murinocardiopsis flavida]